MPWFEPQHATKPTGTSLFNLVIIIGEIPYALCNYIY